MISHEDSFRNRGTGNSHFTRNSFTCSQDGKLQFSVKEQKGLALLLCTRMNRRSGLIDVAT